MCSEGYWTVVIYGVMVCRATLGMTHIRLRRVEKRRDVLPDRLLHHQAMPFYRYSVVVLDVLRCLPGNGRRMIPTVL